jgi:hypothetical protein
MVARRFVSQFQPPLVCSSTLRIAVQRGLQRGHHHMKWGSAAHDAVLLSEGVQLSNPTSPQNSLN